MNLTIEQDLKEVFGQINQKLDRLDAKIDGVAKEVTDIKIELATTKAELKGDIKALDEKITGLGKQVDSVDFVNRGVFVALIIAILGGFAKIFGFISNP
jgi:hypothetical protein